MRVIRIEQSAIRFANNVSKFLDVAIELPGCVGDQGLRSLGRHTAVDYLDFAGLSGMDDAEELVGAGGEAARQA